MFLPDPLLPPLIAWFPTRSPVSVFTDVFAENGRKVTIILSNITAGLKAGGSPWISLA
jgi:hypothetical protein